MRIGICYILLYSGMHVDCLHIFYLTDLVCQSGPSTWPSQVYSKAALYPMANSAAQVLDLPH